jgi:hypothetical protein
LELHRRPWGSSPERGERGKGKGERGAWLGGGGTMGSGCIGSSVWSASSLCLREEELEEREEKGKREREERKEKNRKIAKPINFRGEK